MKQVNITNDEAASCLLLLKRSGSPYVAADIARAMGLSGKRETQRRHVRAIIKHLRETGSMIVATLAGGYWLTEDYGTWKDYNAGRQLDAKRILGETGRRAKIISDRNGQGVLFGPVVSCGIG
jgi:hypothetical protein